MGKLVLSLTGELWEADRPMTATAVSIRVEIDEPLEQLAAEDTNATVFRVRAKLAAEVESRLRAAAKALFAWRLS